MRANTQTSNSSKPTAPSAVFSDIQLLTFILDNEIYGTEIGLIQEVLEYRKITPVPRTPKFMLGVINLRGRVVPVVDLRQHFSMKVTPNTVNTCIVIVDIVVDGEKTPLGILADAVREVVELSGEQITPAPRIGSHIDTRFISGMGKCEEAFIIILNLPRIFADEDLAEFIDAIPSKLVEDDEQRPVSHSGFEEHD